MPGTPIPIMVTKLEGSIGGGGWAPDPADCWGCCHGGRLPVPGEDVVGVSVKRGEGCLEDSQTNHCIYTVSKIYTLIL